jgi:putative protease
MPKPPADNSMAAAEHLPKPMILAPAGNRASFLAALAAGADAVYCGLKSFSARMQAKNFGNDELARLTRLAHAKGIKVYITLNTMLKTVELASAGELLHRLAQCIRPDAVIIQDLALVELVRQTGFRGEVHLSTLANVSFPAALGPIAEKLDIDRVVIPRELDIDEIKAMAANCPDALQLETFIHGALCYGVSGRCYWSSYFGGKSGLRGRCVQPCRRNYTTGNQSRRYFSCQDYSVDVLVKVLQGVPRVRVWKIEGRKKGPHYVYYTVKAYQMLRDHGRDPQMKRDALGLLAQALGRTSTHYNFLPQRPQQPVNTRGQTGSGLMVGKVRGGGGNLSLAPRQALLPGDTLRIGYEDEAGHTRIRVTRSVPKKGRLHLKVPKGRSVRKGTPVFLTDRREEALASMIADLEKELGEMVIPAPAIPPFNLRLPKARRHRQHAITMTVHRSSPHRAARSQGATGLWIGAHMPSRSPRTGHGDTWYWLPPVIWPKDEAFYGDLVETIRRKGGRNFVLNAPWQMALFASTKKARFWAGPFCNLANPLAIQAAQTLGFEGAIVSPELGEPDYLELPRRSPLPLGIVQKGILPLCISRTLAEELRSGQPFDSPRGERAWAANYGADHWIFPNWKLDLRNQQKALLKAGYKLLVELVEPVPKGVQLKKRPGLWNWKVGLQ